MAKKDAETITYAQMGMAAMLPGMVHMLELMQAEVDNMRAQLAAMQNGAIRRRGPGRPKVEKKNGWPVDPAARSREMKRRRAVADKRLKAEGRATVLEQLSKQRKKAWAALPAKEKKRRLAAMVAGRRPKLEKVA